jgi:hypothetical protein
MKIGPTLNRDKRPEILGCSPSRTYQTRARSLSKAQSNCRRVRGKGSASIHIGPTFTCNTGLADMEHTIGAEFATLHYCARPPTTIM